MVTPASIISDTGPLISLEKLENGYQFMEKLYTDVFVPKVVIEELYQGEFTNWDDYKNYYNVGSFLKIVQEELTILEVLKDLDKGEQQAIQLAYNLRLPLLIEEEKGRKIAKQLELKFSGIAGQIIKANREHIISADDAKKMLGELLKNGRIGKRMYYDLVETISNN